MKINTKYHGEVDMADSDILQFNSGMPGFPDERQFVLLPLADTGLSVLQSTNTAEVGFVVTNPFSFFPDYDFKLDDASVEQLELKEELDVQVHTILTVQDPFENTTANLQAPIIINAKNCQAKQVILNDERYKTRHPLFGHKVKG